MEMVKSPLLFFKVMNPHSQLLQGQITQRGLHLQETGKKHKVEQRELIRTYLDDLIGNTHYLLVPEVVQAFSFTPVNATVGEVLGDVDYLSEKGIKSVYCYQALRGAFRWPPNAAISTVRPHGFMLYKNKRRMYKALREDFSISKAHFL